MILVFDIGTTILKGALLSEEGEFICVASRNLGMLNNAGDGCFEADTNKWKTAFKEITSEILSGKTVDLRAVAISGNGPTLVPVDGNGEFLDPVMTWLDRRGVEESAAIGRIHDFYLDPSFYLPKVLWLEKHRPEVFNKARFFLSCPESMIYWLTGEAVTIVPGPYLQRYYWDLELLRKLGLDEEKFPNFEKSGAVVRKVSKLGARNSGLPENVPVVAAGPDFIVTLLGTGSVYPGRACDRSGTSEGINLCTERETTDSRLMCYEHVIEPYFNLSGIISTTGKALEWIKKAVNLQNMGYDEFLEQVEGVPSGSGNLLFLPYLTGERAPIWDTTARGSFIGLGLNHGSREMTMAVLESVGFAIRDVSEVMAENGSVIEELRITGGPSKSRLWNQIKADITGKNILVLESSESELLGNLVLALIALGDSDDKAGTADRIVRIKEIYEPNIENRGIYNELFELYRMSYSRLKKVYKSLTEIKEKK